jgi:hypothetical protein
MAKNKEPEPTQAERHGATHCCAVCGRQLPVRLRWTRRFCSARCRSWAFRNPGHKQRYAQRFKNLKQALAALCGLRNYAAKLQAKADSQSWEERKLLAELAPVLKLYAELATLNAGLSEVRSDLAPGDRTGAEEKPSKATREP